MTVTVLLSFPPSPAAFPTPPLPPSSRAARSELLEAVGRTLLEAVDRTVSVAARNEDSALEEQLAALEPVGVRKTPATREKAKPDRSKSKPTSTRATNGAALKGSVSAPSLDEPGSSSETEGKTAGTAGVRGGKGAGGGRRKKVEASSSGGSTGGGSSGGGSTGGGSATGGTTSGGLTGGGATLTVGSLIAGAGSDVLLAEAKAAVPLSVSAAARTTDAAAEKRGSGAEAGAEEGAAAGAAGGAGGGEARGATGGVAVAAGNGDVRSDASKAAAAVATAAATPADSGPGLDGPGSGLDAGSAPGTTAGSAAGSDAGLSSGLGIEAVTGSDAVNTGIATDIGGAGGSEGMGEGGVGSEGMGEGGVGSEGMGEGGVGSEGGSDMAAQQSKVTERGGCEGEKQDAAVDEEFSVAAEGGVLITGGQSAGEMGSGSEEGVRSGRKVELGGSEVGVGEGAGSKEGVEGEMGSDHNGRGEGVENGVKAEAGVGVGIPGTDVTGGEGARGDSKEGMTGGVREGRLENGGNEEDGEGERRVGEQGGVEMEEGGGVEEAEGEEDGGEGEEEEEEEGEEEGEEDGGEEQEEEEEAEEEGVERDRKTREKVLKASETQRDLEEVYLCTAVGAAAGVEGRERAAEATLNCLSARLQEYKAENEQLEELLHEEVRSGVVHGDEEWCMEMRSGAWEVQGDAVRCEVQRGTTSMRHMSITFPKLQAENEQLEELLHEEVGLGLGEGREGGREGGSGKAVAAGMEAKNREIEALCGALEDAERHSAALQAKLASLQVRMSGQARLPAGAYEWVRGGREGGREGGSGKAVAAGMEAKNREIEALCGALEDAERHSAALQAKLASLQGREGGREGGSGKAVAAGMEAKNREIEALCGALEDAERHSAALQAKLASLQVRMSGQARLPAGAYEWVRGGREGGREGGSGKAVAAGMEAKNREIEALCGALEDAERHSAALQAKLASLQGREGGREGGSGKAVAAGMEAKNRKIEALCGALEDAERHSAALQAKLASLQGREGGREGGSGKAVAAGMEAKNREIEALCGALEDAERHSAALQAKLASLQGREGGREGGSGKAVAAGMEAKNREIEALCSALEDAERHSAALQAKLASLQASSEALSKNRDSTEARMIQALREELAAAERRCDDEHAAHLVTRQEAAARELELEQQVAEGVAALSRMQRAVEERTQRVSSLEEKISVLEMECSSLNSELQAHDDKAKRDLRRPVTADDPSVLAQVQAWKEESERARQLLREAEGKLAGSEAEVQKLRVEVEAHKRDADSSSLQANAEMEKRFKELTELLCLKQSQLETMTSERQAAMLQLNKERRELQLAKAQAERDRAARRSMLMAADEEDSEMQSLESVGLPNRRFIGKRIQQAAKLIDHGTVTAGRFLWRRPLARLGLVCYLVFVHLFLMYLLHRLQEQADELLNKDQVYLAAEAAAGIVKPHPARR
ncbi:unnamed protein product [Closterium sp. Naga37s-1]|nr:unnamed protein product [Closterium sp. Naga37s-1]